MTLFLAATLLQSHMTIPVSSVPDLISLPHRLTLLHSDPSPDPSIVATYLSILPVPTLAHLLSPGQCVSMPPEPYPKRNPTPVPTSLLTMLLGSGQCAIGLQCGQYSAHSRRTNPNAKPNPNLNPSSHRETQTQT